MCVEVCALHAQGEHEQGLSVQARRGDALTSEPRNGIAERMTQLHSRRAKQKPTRSSQRTHAGQKAPPAVLALAAASSNHAEENAMNEIVQMVAQKTGIGEDKARQAVQVVMEHLRSRLPGP